MDFQDQFVGVSFSPLKFGILTIFVLFFICNDFNENFWNLQDRLIQLRGTSRIFSEFFVHIPSPGTRFFARKTWFWHFWSYKSRDSGPPRAQNWNFNNLIDKSSWEEHLFFHSLLQERFLKLEKRDLSARKCHKKCDFRPVNAPIATCNDSIDKFEWVEHLKFFSEFFLHFLLQKQFWMFEKRDWSARKCPTKRDFRLVNASIATCTEWIDRSEWEEGSTFFQNFSSIPFSRNSF